MAKVTRTLNPLHFEDLEPHRFEDLIRQLTYDFRPWKRLEPTGRLGADDGIDIRGVEAIFVDEPDDPEGEEEDNRPGKIERFWTIQCKREKSVHPADVKKIIKEAIPESGEVPYGFILAAACDFSKKSRDTFILELRDRGVEEFYLWGKADLEDLLFLPKNDHLLFAYFGISLQMRRKNVKTAIRSEIAWKKHLFSKLGGLGPVVPKSVLVRDVDYNPHHDLEAMRAMVLAKKLYYCNFIGHHYPGHLSFLVGNHHGYLDDDGIKWDCHASKTIPYNEMVHYDVIRELNRDALTYEDAQKYYMFQRNRVSVDIELLIPYERIIAIDDIGDVANPGTHVIVEPGPVGLMFELPYYLKASRAGLPNGEIYLRQEDRIVHFPIDERLPELGKIDGETSELAE